MERALKLKVRKVIKETNDAVSIHFKQPLLKKIKYKSGQFLTLLVDVNGTVERRCYSLNSTPKVDNYISVTVKRIKDGKVSNHLFNTIKEGDKVNVLLPMGNFTVTPDKKNRRHIVLFGGGSGITPLISILKAVLTFEPNSHVSLIYGNRDIESVIFSKELTDYQKTFKDRMHLIHVLENPGDFPDCYKGRIERSQVAALLENVPDFPAELTEYYICGPSGMMVEAEEGLKLCNIPENKINIERFSAPPPSAQEVKASGPMLENREVKIVFKGESHNIPVKAGTTILDAALDKGLKLPYVCMDGICGSCMATRISGEVFMRKGHILSKKDLEADQILPCICKPLTNNVNIEYS